MLTDSQQHQHDVLRTVGGKLINNRDGWFREVPYADVHQQSGTIREKIGGLNITAMFKLVEMGLVVCVREPAPSPAAPVTSGYLFLLPDLAKDVSGPRYVRVGQLDKELP
jgi:hypothetical protein